METGKRSMGNHRHYIAGHPNRSGRFKFLMRLEAEREARRKRKKFTLAMFSSVSEAFSAWRAGR